MRGNCYVTSEALYHLLGGKRAGWKAYVMRTENDTHWFLKHESGVIVDATAAQFRGHVPDYSAARGTGFLTKTPSKKARVLMHNMLWQEGK